MSQDYEIVESRRNFTTSNQDKDTLAPFQNPSIGDAIAENFGQILNLASSYVELEKMKVQSALIIKQMEETRKSLKGEAENYVIKKNADTDSVIQRMTNVRMMMRDFYQYNTNANLSGEDFSRIITVILTELGGL